MVVATDIEHAHQVALALEAWGEACHVVTNKTLGPQQVINLFRHSDCRWIVAVGMISEGTDLPRLQVCCYLSRVRTELHYHQVPGRMIRRTGETDNQAWLFMLAEPTLQSFAERIAEDLPADIAVLSKVHLPSENTEQGHTEKGIIYDIDDISVSDLGSLERDPHSGRTEPSFSSTPCYQIIFFHHFRQMLLDFLGSSSLHVDLA